MASESSTFAVLPSKQTVQHSPSLLQGKELTTKLSPQITFSPPLKLRSFPSEPQTRRKRRRTCEQHSFQQLATTNQINLGFSDKNPSLKPDVHFVSCPQNFTFQSNEVNKSVQESETKQPSFFVKNHRQLPRKSPSGIGRNFSNAGLVSLDVNNVGSEREEGKMSVDFSKAIEDAISRIESLIPSLKKLVKTVHSSEQKSVDNSEFPNISSSVNPLGKEKGLISTNEQCLTKKSSGLGETMLSKQTSQMLMKCNSPAPSLVKWSRNIDYVGNDGGMQQQMYYLKGDVDSKEMFYQRMFDKPSDWVSVQSSDKMKNLKLEKKSNAQLISQVLGPKFKAVFGRPESLEGTSSRSGSFASHASECVQGLGLMPQQSYCGEAIEREATLSHCSQVPYAGSTKSMRPTGTSNMRTSHQKWSQSHTDGRIAQEMDQSSSMIRSRDSLNQNNLNRKNMKEPLHSKVAPHDQISEDTSWSSCASSSAATEQSGSLSSSSGSYEFSGSDSYDSDESEPLHEKVGQFTRMKQPEVTDSTASGYDDTSSYSNSRDEYSDAKSLSQMSSARLHKWDSQKERRKKRGRLRRLRRKLGMIFHHHHHHHHHHYRDEPNAHHARSFWKQLGEMFHHTNNANHRQKPNSEKPRKSEIKTVVKRKQGHFHALVSGLLKHMKLSKKSKQVKNGIEGLGSGRHGGKKEGKKMLWWPKNHGGRGGVKVSNKGKVRLGNYRTKSFAAAKMILKK